MISRPRRIANRPAPVTLPAAGCAPTPQYRRSGHTVRFSDYSQVHSAAGDAINNDYVRNLPGLKRNIALTAWTPVFRHLFCPSKGRQLCCFLRCRRRSRLVRWSGWMLLLTVKHVIADFMLQTSWMAIGKDQKTGWALPLLAHCLVHLAVAMTLILIVAPRFWFVALIDFAIHITVDRAQGDHRVVVRRDAGAGASMVLDADRRRSGAAPPDRFRPGDLHGGELILPRSGPA